MILSNIEETFDVLKRVKLEKERRSPDMGLEPMALRLKVWCSTDWANRAPMESSREKVSTYL